MAEGVEVTPLRPSERIGYHSINSSALDENTSAQHDHEVDLFSQNNDGYSAELDQMGFIEAVNLNRGAVGWSIFFSLGIIMTAFDSQLLGNLYATPAFRRDFGYDFNGTYIIPAGWQTMLGMGGPVGQCFGALCAAYPMEAFGRKKTFAACVILTAGCVFIQFFARSLKVLLLGELLGGLILGSYAIVAPSYASEVCPVPLRGILTAFINLCFVLGQLLANLIMAGTQRLDSHWAYSAPFAAQWLWPLIILAGIPFAPESPWWLMRKGRFEDAEASLTQLASGTKGVKRTLTMIIETDRLEAELETGTTYLDCFKSTNRRRTFISVGVYTIQIFSGISMAGYATYFLQLAGLPVNRAFDMGIVFLAVGFIGTVCSWILLSRFGRRSIYTTGIAILAIVMFIVGVMDLVPNYSDRPVVSWIQSILLVLWNGIYDLTIGPVCFVIICEVSATRIRSKTIAIATAVQAVMAMVMTFTFPYMINPDQLNLRGKLGFLFGGLSVLSFSWAYFHVPETGGRTYEELDIMFEKNVLTRDFKNFKLE